MIVPTTWIEAPAMTQTRRPKRSLHGKATVQHPSQEAKRNDATIIDVVVVFGA
jgi:hypothetical protein